MGERLRDTMRLLLLVNFAAACMNAPDGGYESAEDVRSPPHEMIEYFTDCADGLVEDYDIIFVTMSQWYIDTVFKCDMKSSCWKKSIKGSGNIPPEIDTREKMQKMLECTMAFFSSGFADSIDAPVSDDDFPDTARDVLLPHFNFYDYFTTSNDNLPRGMQHGGTIDGEIEDSFFGELVFPYGHVAEHISGRFGKRK